MAENTNEQIVPTDRNDPYWVRSHPQHAEAVKSVAAKFAAKYPEAPTVSEPELVLDETGPDTPWQRLIADANAKAHTAALDKQIEAAMKTAEYKKGDPAAVAAVARLFEQRHPDDQGEHRRWLWQEAS